MRESNLFMLPQFVFGVPIFKIPDLSYSILKNQKPDNLLLELFDTEQSKYFKIGTIKQYIRNE